MEILEVNNIGCLKNINNPIVLGDNAFIYGLNGTGKSTLKELFVNSFRDNSKLTPTFGIKSNNCGAKIKIFNKEVEFIKGKIKNPLRGFVHVYDTNYVENNIYVNGEISEDNKSEYYRLFVGESVNKKIKQLLDKHNNMIQKINTINADMLNFKNAISIIDDVNKLWHEVNEFCKIEFDLEYAIENTLKRRIENNINELSLSKANWLKQGTKFQSNPNICPFCGQIISNEINQELISHYGEVINETQNIISESKEKCKNLKNSVLQLSCDELYYIDLDSFIKVKNDLIELLNEKEKNINKKKNLNNNSLVNLLKKYNDFKKFVDDFNILISDLNISDLFSIELISDDYSKIITNKFNNMKNRIKNNISDTALQDNLIENLKIVCKSNIGIKKEYNDIVNSQNVNISSSLNYINKKLVEYDFKYSLTTKLVSEKKLKTGATPLLELSLVPNVCSTAVQDMNKEKIKNILSEGEKSILSWIFFLLDLNDKLNKGNHLIIIDDPISSYDSFRRFNLTSELDLILKKPANKEVLLLSHEKSFSNVLSGTQKFNTFIMRDGLINSLDIKDIVESDFKHDILKISEFGLIDTKEKVIEFMIVSRNVIDYYKSINDFVKAKYFGISKYKKMYAIASEIIHLQRNDLPQEYIDYVVKVIKKIANKNVLFEFDESKINLACLNLSTCLTNINNVYLARVKINKRAIDLLNAHSLSYKNESTTGELVNMTHDEELISDDEYDHYKRFLPLLNVYNHVNDNYGLRRADCDEIKKQNMFDYLNSI